MTTRADQGPHEARFDITRTDGHPIDPSRRYIVLSFDGSDPEAVAALRHYVELKRPINSALAETLERHLDNPTDAPAQHRWAR